MPNPKISFDDFLRDWNLKSLHDLALTQAPSPPSLPSFVELARLDSTPPPPAGKGLFEALVGDTLPLYQDSVEHPDKFSSEGIALLAELAQGGKKVSELSPEDKRLLDLATIDFANALPKAKHLPLRRRAPPREKPTETSDPIRGVDTPEEAPTAYWWLK